MMRMFVSTHVILIVLVVSTTIDAARIFYLPLPKIHPSQSQHQQEQQIHVPKNLEEPAKKSTASDEFIPASAMEQEEIEKRGDAFDWEALVDKEVNAKRRITVNELLPESFRQLQEQYPSDELMGQKINDEKETEESFDKITQTNREGFLEKPWIVDSVHERAERLQSNPEILAKDRRQHRNDKLFIVIVGTCCVVGVVGLLAAAGFWYKVQKRAAAAAVAEYPSYGVTGPNSSGGKISPSSTMSDRKLAQSAQMFHYQQQRQQMIAQEKDLLDAKPVNSDDSDDEAPTEGDYTVYECPGLAPTGEMEVRNPLFAEPDSSMVPSATNSHYPQPSSSSPTKEKFLP